MDYSKVIELLNDGEVASQILQSHADKYEIINAIFELYSSHNRLEELIKWVIKDHIKQTTDQNQLFKKSVALSILIKALFEEDKGRRFSTKYYGILVDKLSIENSNPANAIREFLIELLDLVSHCPIYLRIVFRQMENDFADQYKANHSWSTSRVLLQILGDQILRFPTCLFIDKVFPEYFLKRCSETADILMNIFSTPDKKMWTSDDRLLHSLCKGFTMEFDKALIDNENIKRCQIIIESSIIQTINEERNQKAYDDILAMIHKNDIQQGINQIIDDQNIIKEILNIGNTIDWEKKRIGKNGETSIFAKRHLTERILYHKVVSDFEKVDMRLLFEFMIDFQFQFDMRLDRRWSECRWIERKSLLTGDLYMAFKSYWPIEPRECLVSISGIWDPKRPIILMHSIYRDDVPTVYKRIETKDLLIFDPIDNGVRLTTIGWGDMKGNIPTWVITTGIIKATVSYYERVKKYFQSQKKI